MFIHTVAEGDTVFKIARNYSTSPIKIIENNDLKNPDVLSVGEELLILTPTRTYTARGGDTVAKIARRFGIKRSMLYRNNPYLCGQDKVYPSEVLAIRYDAPSLGAITANGYFFSGCDEDLLRRALPYLTYITVASAVADSFDGLKFLFDDTPVLNAARESGKIPLMRVFDASDHSFYSDKEKRGFFIDMLISAAKERGYRGITLASKNAADIKCDALSEFLLEMRKRLIGCDLILFSEIDLNSDAPRTDLSDAHIIMYSKCHLEGIPSFLDGERRIFSDYAECYESTKAFVDLTPYASDGYDTYPLSDALEKAHRIHAELKGDAQKKILSFDYTHHHGAVGEGRRMRFESLENTKAKLELLSELGYMGVSFDIARTPAQILMLINALFSCENVFSAAGYDM